MDARIAPPFMEATDASRLVCVVVVSYQEYSLTRRGQCGASRGSLKKERKKTDNPREGWEDGTPPPHRDFKEGTVWC